MSGVAAVPAYVGEDFKDAPPGHRFGLYLQVWGDRKDWLINKTDKYQALNRLVGLAPEDKKRLDAMQARQRSVVDSLPTEEHLFIPAKSTAPFVTGTGMEHPLENGFAFLNPYGLPYLPGSSIKGVLRRAAEELALELYGESDGWSPLIVWWLFGFEPSSVYLSQAESTERAKVPEVLLETAEQFREQYRNLLSRISADEESLRAFIRVAVGDAGKRARYAAEPKQFLQDLVKDKSLRESVRTRGALSFWDVYPTPYQHRLAVDILNPHFTNYYQSGHTPGDFGQPIPVFFLTLPADSSFEFYVRCEVSRLPPVLRESWQSLLETAFVYAFDWLGFGAKTAVGYGQMYKDHQRLKKLAEEQQRLAEAQHQAEIAAQPEEVRELTQLKELFGQEQAKNRCDKNGPLAQKASSVLALSQHWPYAFRIEAADCIEQIYQYLKWPGNKAKRKQQIEALRRKDSE